MWTVSHVVLACIHSLLLMPRALAPSTHCKLSAPQSDFIHSIALYLAAFPHLVHTHTGTASVCDRFSNGKEDWAEQYCGLRLRFKVPFCWSFSPVSFGNLKTHILTAIECLSCFLACFLFVKTVTTLSTVSSSSRPGRFQSFQAAHRLHCVIFY